MGDYENIRKMIESGRTVLGLEFGSTRIKAVLVDEDHHPIASGDHEWENRLDHGIWTYTLDDIWTGLRDGKWQRMWKRNMIRHLPPSALSDSAR